MILTCIKRKIIKIFFINKLSIKQNLQKMSSKSTLNTSNSFINQKWNKFPILVINNIEFNTDKSLITFATSSGYRIYDNKTFTLLNEIWNNQEILGSLKKATVLYSSPLICFLGSDNNEYYKCTQIFFYNEKMRKTIGIIDFHEKVYNFFLTKYLIIFCFINKIYIFELSTLKYICKIDNIEFDEQLVSVNECYYNGKRIINLGYISSNYQNKNVVNLISFYIDNKFKLTHCKKNGIITMFDNIKQIHLEKEKKLIVVSEFGNKIHIYETDNNQLLYCIYMGNQRLNINNLSFNENEKFLLCICDLDEINIFKLDNIKGKYNCNCISHPDKEIKYKRKSSNNSFLGGYFTRMFNDSTEPFLYNNINECGGFYKCYFDHKKKDEITLINNFGSIIKYKFNRKKEKEKLKIIKKIQVIEEDLIDDFE